MTTTDLNEWRMKTKGEQMFLGCPCGSENGWQVVTVASGDAPVIAGIICNDCNEEQGVAFGKVGL